MNYSTLLRSGTLSLAMLLVAQPLLWGYTPQNFGSFSGKKNSTKRSIAEEVIDDEGSNQAPAKQAPKPPVRKTAKPVAVPKAVIVPDEYDPLLDAPNRWPAPKGKKYPTGIDKTSERLLDLERVVRGEALDGLGSLRATAMVKEGGRTYAYTYFWKDSDKLRVEIEHKLLGVTYRTVRGWDGERAWTREVLPEEERPLPLGVVAQAMMLLEDNPVGLLHRWRERGHAYRYTGEVKSNLRNAYCVEAKLNGGPLVFYYFNPETYMIDRFGYPKHVSPVSGDGDCLVLSREKHGGIWFDKKRVHYVDGDPLRTVEFESYELNPALDDGLFAPPVVREYWLRQKP